MKAISVILVLTFLMLWTATAAAFHDGGVAHCNGCHTMHNSQDGVLVDAGSPNGNAWLLNQPDPSSVCIDCHDHLDRTFPIGGDPLAPPSQREGGNFIFLIEDNLNDGHGGSDPANAIPGDAAGHNIISAANGLVADATLTSAPGGTFPASVMGCTSCHDPHGSGDFRFLYSVGNSVQDGIAIFLNPAPDAEGVSIFAPVNSTFHTAYKAGMSAWCGNCHGDFHANGTKLIHPSGMTLGGSIALTYGLYNGTGAISTGDPALSYLMEVPFEDPANTNLSTAGPGASSQISCITCHRAHATSAPDAGRWDFSVTFLHEDGVESGSFAIPNPYAFTQRSLCNKCHAKDFGDQEVTDKVDDELPPPGPRPNPTSKYPSRHRI